jgi:hypothetical protein
MAPPVALSIVDGRNSRQSDARTYSRRVNLATRGSVGPRLADVLISALPLPLVFLLPETRQRPAA